MIVWKSGKQWYEIQAYTQIKNSAKVEEKIDRSNFPTDFALRLEYFQQMLDMSTKSAGKLDLSKIVCIFPNLNFVCVR